MKWLSALLRRKPAPKVTIEIHTDGLMGVDFAARVDRQITDMRRRGLL